MKNRARGGEKVGSTRLRRTGWILSLVVILEAVSASPSPSSLLLFSPVANFSSQRANDLGISGGILPGTRSESRLPVASRKSLRLRLARYPNDGLILTMIQRVVSR